MVWFGQDLQTLLLLVDPINSLISSSSRVWTGTCVQSDVRVFLCVGSAPLTGPTRGDSGRSARSAGGYYNRAGGEAINVIS
eukprot:3264552-Pyramimonas_sp.AAC.1